MPKHLDILLTVIFALTLSTAMLWPMDQPKVTPDGSDKIIHLIAFAALSFPLARTGRFGLMPILFAASAFGGAIELIQPNFNRSADINDWFVDIVGVILGIACGLLYHRFRKH